MSLAHASSPAIWRIGDFSFVFEYKSAVIAVDPVLTEPISTGLILCTQADHLDAASVCALLAHSPRSKLVLPKSVASHANQLGISYHRMVTTDSGLRVEFLDDRIYAVPSAHPELDWTAIGGFPYLGYLVRFGTCTIYHPGDCVPYDGLAGRLRPYNVTVAILPVGGRPNYFDVHEAAQLAEEIGASWLIPMRCKTNDEFVTHMLGQRPQQRFKILDIGEKWTVPA